MGNDGNKKTIIQELKNTNLDIMFTLSPSKLNIFICGKYDINSLYLQLTKEEKNEISNINNNENYYKKSRCGLNYNNTRKIFAKSDWKFYELSPIKGSKECENLKNLIERKIGNIKEKKIQNVIIYNCAEKDDNDFEILNQLNKIERTSHPFVIFISQNKTKKNYNEYIIRNELKNKRFFFDIFNIYHVSYENEIIEILYKIFNYSCPINTEIDNNHYISDKCLNIYLVGKPGIGKSSFINEIFGEKKALENIGENQTSKIKKYVFTDKKGRINIFDTPGFSTNGQELSEIKKKVEDIYSEYLLNKDLIHCFLYFLDGRVQRTFDDNEIELIRSIYEKQMTYFSNLPKIFFIINFTNKTEENDINSYKNIILRNLKERFPNYPDLSNKENIIEINLKRDIQNNRELKFGIDEIFHKMYNYFEPHKINIKEIENVANNNDNNNENRIINHEEILNRQIEILNRSMFFKFYKRYQDYKDSYISLCEQKIILSKIETQRIGLFMSNKDSTKCEEIRRNMLEYINNHLKGFCSDIPFDKNDYIISEDEKDSFFIKRWFKMRENCPLITEQKGKDYLEKYKTIIKDNHNISCCIYMADLYNNSIDLLKTISNNIKLNYIIEEENINFIKNMIKAEQESINEHIKKSNNHKNIEIVNNYIENNQFIIELNIDIEHPLIECFVEVVEKYYIFKIEINEKEIISLEKSILEIQLENEEEYKEIKKGKEKNKYIVIYDLRKTKKSKKGQQF